MMAFLEFKKLPEVITIILKPRGIYEVEGMAELVSFRAKSRLRWSWEVIELWKIKANELLEQRDVGVLPWIALTEIEGDPEPVFRECRRRIEVDASPDQVANMLAVTWVFAGSRYDSTGWLHQLFGGRQAMLESSVLRDLKDEWITEGRQEGAIETSRKAIELILSRRFDADLAEVHEALREVVDEGKLTDLMSFALECPDLDAFRARLVSLS